MVDSPTEEAAPGDATDPADETETTTAAPAEIKPARRIRYRRDSIKLDPKAIVERIIRFYNDDITDRTDETQARLQRIAKFRGWTEGKDFPWPDSSDVALPDMMTQSLRTQDTLANATLQVRPVISASAIVSDADKPKEAVVDRLLDFQFFVENQGEMVIGDLVDDFVNEPAATAFIPWITETRETSDVRVFGALPDQGEPAQWFRATLVKEFPAYDAQILNDGWDWRLTPQDPNSADKPFQAGFYTRAGGVVEMVAKREIVVFDGPCIIRKAYDQVLFPPRSANLQMPGPSNPGGAPHVILVDWPTVDEIKRLAASGFYDLPNRDDLDALPNQYVDRSQDQNETQRDALAGTTAPQKPQKGAESHGTLTRLLCFDSYDYDGDGLDEDVIFWVLLEPKLLLKAKPLTEMYPANPPRRPLASSSFIPVPGRHSGISLLETIEGLHDVSKIAYDQMVDGGTIATSPFGFYRSTSGLRNEVIHMAPGELYPTSNPSGDIYFPQFNNNAAAFGINLLTLVDSWEQKLTMQGDLQMGRVPAGKSSALRSAAAQSMIANQGEARPERILRRWFMLLAEVWNQMHELNRAFLPPNKVFLIGTPKGDAENPYQTITQRSEIDGRFQFTFAANVLNTSKAALQQSLESIAAMLITPFFIQAGLVTPAKAYQLALDIIKARGQDGTKYMQEPEPGLDKPPIFAAEAMLLIMRNEAPDGRPESHEDPGGAIGHMQELQAYAAREEFGHLTPEQVDLFKVWFAKVKDFAVLQQRKQALVQASQQQQQGGQPGPGQPPGPQPNPNPGTMISGPNELLNESLPSAGGGANTGKVAA